MCAGMKKWKGIFVIFVLFCAVAFPVPVQADTKNMNLKATVTGKTSVKLNWKKKTAAGYDIYRAPCKADGSPGKYQKVASVSGKKTSYQDNVAYKKYYTYKIKAFKKKAGKKIYTHEGVNMAYAGVGKADWQENLYSDATVSPDFIQLEMNVPEGMKPTGFEIYRSEGDLSYQKIAKMKTNAAYAVYTDEDVAAGTSYSYRARAYKNIGKKTIYGKYSVPIRLAAVNQIGKYKVSSLLQTNQNVSNISLAVTSDSDNADTIFSGELGGTQTMYTDTDSDDFIYLEPIKYSFDNQTWQELKKQEIVLKPGQTIYIMLQEENGKAFDYKISGVEESQILDLGVRYNDLYALMDINLTQGTAEAERNGELYH